MAFSVGVEMLNLRLRKHSEEPVKFKLRYSSDSPTPVKELEIKDETRRNSKQKRK
jgi:hypothetical protein